MKSGMGQTKMKIPALYFIQQLQNMIYNSGQD